MNTKRSPDHGNVTNFVLYLPQRRMNIKEESSVDVIGAHLPKMSLIPATRTKTHSVVKYVVLSFQRRLPSSADIPWAARLAHATNE